MSAHGPDFKLSDEFFAGIRTVAAIDKAKGKRMTHTPGPWHAKVAPSDESWNGKPGLVFGPPAADGTNYAPLAECGNRADAVLIAAAPELLEALQEFAKVGLSHNSRGVHFDSLVGKKVRAAIARATGQ